MGHEDACDVGKTQGFGLGVCRFFEDARRDEDRGNSERFEVDRVVHTARRAGASIREGFDHEPALFRDLPAEIRRRRPRERRLPVGTHLDIGVLPP